MSQSHARCTLALALIVAFVCGAHLWHASHQINVKIFEEIQHITTAAYVYVFAPESVLQQLYPPWTYVVSLPFFMLFGVSRFSAMVSVLPFLVLLAASTAWIAGSLSKKPWAAVFSVVAVFSFPFLLDLSRLYMLDFPLTAMVAASVAALIRSRGFVERNWSVVFGILCGLGMWTRASFAAFLIGPVLVEAILLFPGLSTGKGAGKRRLNFILSGALALTIAAAYYAPNLSAILDFQQSRIDTSAGGYGAMPTMTFAKGLIFYVFNFFNLQVGWLMLPIILVAFCSYFRSEAKGKLYLVLWVAAPLVIFSFFDWKTNRFLIPVLPAAAIGIGIGLTELKKPILRLLLTAGFLVVAIFQFSVSTFPLVRFSQADYVAPPDMQKLLPNWLTPIDYWNDLRLGPPDGKLDLTLPMAQAILDAQSQRRGKVSIVWLQSETNGMETTDLGQNHHFGSRLLFNLVRMGADSYLEHIRFRVNGEAKVNLSAFNTYRKDAPRQPYGRPLKRAEVFNRIRDADIVVSNAPNTLEDLGLSDGFDLIFLSATAPYDLWVFAGSLGGDRIEQPAPEDMIWAPAGTFVMGCSPSDTGCFDHENPAHPVNLDGFWVDIFETTNEKHDQCVSENVCAPSIYSADPNWNTPNRPVVGVSWHDAKTFCEWNGKRLLSEAEWEYAARAGSKQKRYGPIEQVAWYWDNAGKTTHPVGRKEPNAWGLYDVLGNAEEWCEDFFDDRLYDRSPFQNPVNRHGPNLSMRPENWNSVPESVKKNLRVTRGASWDSVPRSTRFSHRVWTGADYKIDFIGIRCARD